MVLSCFLSHWSGTFYGVGRFRLMILGLDLDLGLGLCFRIGDRDCDDEIAS